MFESTLRGKALKKYFKNRNNIDVGFFTNYPEDCDDRDRNYAMFTGECTLINGKLVSTDGDSYSFDCDYAVYTDNTLLIYQYAQWSSDNGLDLKEKVKQWVGNIRKDMMDDFSKFIIVHFSDVAMDDYSAETFIGFFTSFEELFEFIDSWLTKLQSYMGKLTKQEKFMLSKNDDGSYNLMWYDDWIE